MPVRPYSSALLVAALAGANATATIGTISLIETDHRGELVPISYDFVAYASGNRPSCRLVVEVDIDGTGLWREICRRTFGGSLTAYARGQALGAKVRARLLNDATAQSATCTGMIWLVPSASR